MATLDLTGKIAVVTGSGRGIGRAIAEKFAAHGATVVLNGKSDSDALNAAAEELAGTHGVRSIAFCGDISRSETASELFRCVFRTFGRLDILVNNAGVLRDGLIGMIRTEDLDETIRTNLVGALLCIQASARLIERSGGGSIINISSIIGVKGNAGQLVYGASKGGLITATLSASKELAAKGIRVNAIAPGYIDTDMIRAIPPAVHQQRLDSIAMGRIGTPDDIANGALFLASDLSSYVTGQVLGIDGGMQL